jgi:hypothetical protein
MSLREILATLAELEPRIQQGMKELEEMLNPASK